MTKRKKYMLCGTAAGAVIGMLAYFAWKQSVVLITIPSILGGHLAVWWGTRTGRITAEDLEDRMITLFPKR